MTHPADDIEDRLTTALHAEADGVRPEPGSLEAIRTRGRAARRRRRAVLTGAGVAALVAVAVAVPAIDRANQNVTTASDQGSTTTTEAPDVVTDPAPAPGDLDGALWPDPAGELFTDPVDAARSFVDTVIGVEDPPLSAFRPGEPGAGEVDLFARGEDGRQLDRVASTLVLRHLDGEHWFVTAAMSADVQVDSPEPLADVSSPATITGQGRGFEGTIVAELRSRTATADLLADEPTIAGSGEALSPFSVDLSFEAPASRIGMLIAHDDPGAELSVPSFAALPVRFVAESPPAGSGEPGGPGTTVATTPPGYEFTSQPLWPFRTQADADEWLASSREGGHQPWHASADMTALAFTTGYLGFGEIDQVTSTEVGATEAWIGVGYEPEPGVLSTSAVIHLVRFGPDPEAPWEVVGTRDTVLTLDTPSYGSSVSSPVTVGGTITGVDENLRVQVRQQSSEAPLGESPGVPAGGEGMPWETSVSFAGATDEALTIVVSSGGHVQDVEIFAITGVRR